VTFDTWFRAQFDKVPKVTLSEARRRMNEAENALAKARTVHDEAEWYMTTREAARMAWDAATSKETKR
jgi:hypothetical protein